MIMGRFIDNIRYPDEEFYGWDDRDLFTDKINALTNSVAKTDGIEKKNYQDTLAELELRWTEKQSGLSWEELNKRWDTREEASKAVKAEQHLTITQAEPIRADEVFLRCSFRASPYIPTSYGFFRLQSGQRFPISWRVISPEVNEICFGIKATKDDFHNVGSFVGTLEYS